MALVSIIGSATIPTERALILLQYLFKQKGVNLISKINKKSIYVK